MGRSEVNKYCVDIGHVCAVSEDTHPAALRVVVMTDGAAAGMAPGQSVLME